MWTVDPCAENSPREAVTAWTSFPCCYHVKETIRHLAAPALIKASGRLPWIIKREVEFIFIHKWAKEEYGQVQRRLTQNDWWEAHPSFPTLIAPYWTNTIFSKALEGLMLKLKLQHLKLKLKLQHAEALDIRCKELTHWKRPWWWERLRAEGEGDDRGWDGWMASLAQWTWVWASSGRQWRIGKPGELQSIGLQRVGHDWTTILLPIWLTQYSQKQMRTRAHKFSSRKGNLT